MSKPPIRFVFGLHLHQPVGNFGYVFETTFATCTRRFSPVRRDAGLLPVVIHTSGLLLDWPAS